MSAARDIPRTLSSRVFLGPYRANREFLIFEELAAIFRKTSGLADILRKALQPLADKIKFASVFGSVAQGKARPESDVDVIVVGRVSFRKVVLALAQTRERLGRDVNPIVMTPGGFASKRRAKDRFVNRIIREPKIFLVGSESDISGKR